MVPTYISASPSVSPDPPLEDRQDALLELSRSLLGERERDDVPRLNARLSQDRGDPLRDDLGLAGAGTSDDL